MRCKLLGVLMFSLLVNYPVKAQQVALLDRLLDNFSNKAISNPSSTLFLHCDKTVYTNNETIWFAGYLQFNRGTPLQAHHTLSVSLYNLELKKIILSELYAMEDGISSGSILLPDSIAPGNYRLLAYSNVVDKKGMPLEVFSQPLTIKTTLEDKFSASMLLLDTAKTFSGNRRVSIRALGIPIQKNGQYLPATVRYRIGSGVEQTAQTNGDGEAILGIGKEQLNELNNQVYASVSYDNQTRYVSLALPVQDAKHIKVGFYPEGGDLSAGILSKVGIESKTIYGQAVSLRAILLKDGVPVDTVETGSSGMGSFKLRPVAGSAYSLKAFKSNLLDKDTLYYLPGVSTALPVISLEQAVVSDTLKFILTSSLTKSYHLVLHNTHDLLASFKVEAGAKGREVKVALQEVPKGVAAVMVLDSTGNPLLERLFFAHYTPSELIAATTDKAVYKTREKVTLKLRLQDAGQALVSVAAVQGNRIEGTKFKDMESYTYLEHELGSLPLSVTGNGYRDKSYLEDLLLIKGWRRFVWSDPVDTVSSYRSLGFSGKVTMNGKELKKPVDLIIWRDSLIGYAKTDAMGRFELTPDEVLVPSGKPLILSVNTSFKELYKIDLYSPFTQINEQLEKDQQIDRSKISPKLSVSSKHEDLKELENRLKIQTVEIKKNKDDELYGRKDAIKQNACGDYVCLNGIFNCPNHGPNKFSTIPEKGKTYISAKGAVLYSGCTIESYDKFKYQLASGRKLSKEFYVNDYQQEVTENDYESTVFWAPFIALSATKDTEISFYTSALKAPYRLIIQGVGEKQVVTGGTIFKVE